MLEGQTAIVTGAARGIGRHAAQTLGEQGAKLAMVDIDKARIEKAAAELAAAGIEALPIEADVREEVSVKAMVDTALGHYGKIDILVNNAAVVTHFQWGNVPIWPKVKDMDLGFWDKVIHTNLGGTFLCTKHIIPHMEKQRSGHVINLYGGGNPERIGACAYSVTKDAIRCFTQFVAEEERDSGICVVIVSPGHAIATEDAPEEARGRLPGPAILEDVFVSAALADMKHTGHMFEKKDGQLTVTA